MYLSRFLSIQKFPLVYPLIYPFFSSLQKFFLFIFIDFSLGFQDFVYIQDGFPYSNQHKLLLFFNQVVIFIQVERGIQGKDISVITFKIQCQEFPGGTVGYGSVAPTAMVQVTAESQVQSLALGTFTCCRRGHQKDTMPTVTLKKRYLR